MKEFDFVIAEVSYPSTGQGIELGWANTENIPIICIYTQGSTISNSLHVITELIFPYLNTLDMIKILENNLP